MVCHGGVAGDPCATEKERKRKEKGRTGQGMGAGLHVVLKSSEKFSAAPTQIGWVLDG